MGKPDNHVDDSNCGCMQCQAGLDKKQAFIALQQVSAAHGYHRD